MIFFYSETFGRVVDVTDLFMDEANTFMNFNEYSHIEDLIYVGY